MHGGPQNAAAKVMYVLLRVRKVSVYGAVVVMCIHLHSKLQFGCGCYDC